MGSGELIGSLLPHGLIDEFLLMIHPLVLGEGRQLFAEAEQAFELKLVEGKPTDVGVIIATYRPS